MASTAIGRETCTAIRLQYLGGSFLLLICYILRKTGTKTIAANCSKYINLGTVAQKVHRHCVNRLRPCGLWQVMILRAVINTFKEH